MKEYSSGVNTLILGISFVINVLPISAIILLLEQNCKQNKKKIAYLRNGIFTGKSRKRFQLSCFKFSSLLHPKACDLWTPCKPMQTGLVYVKEWGG